MYYYSITAVMEEASVRVVFAADVACANTRTVASAVFALDIANQFLIDTKREQRNVIEEMNKNIRGNVISLNVNSNHLRRSLEKAAGKLCTKFSKAKRGAERKKIKDSRTRIILQSDDIVDVSSVQNELQTEVKCMNNIWWLNKGKYMYNKNVH